MNSTLRRPLVLVGAFVLVVAVAFAVVMFVIIRGADEKAPAIVAYAHGRTVTVEPLKYCTINLSSCSDGEIAALDVPLDTPLQLSLPHEIASAPWRLVMVFQAPDGSLVPRERSFAADSTIAVTVQSEDNPRLRLAGVEIQLPSAAIDESGAPLARAIWSIKTA